MLESMTTKLQFKNAKMILKVTAAIALAVLTPSAFSPMLNKIPVADAVTCSTASGSHCYAIEKKTTSTYGNQAQTTVTQLTLPSNYCSNGDFSDIEEWVNFANGGWVEMGYTIGKIQGSCTTSPVTFHAWYVSGVYQEYNDGSISVGSQPLYTVDDAAADGTWFFLKNGVSVNYITSPYIQGADNWVGAETTTNSAGIPSTDINYIAYDSGPGTFNYWTSASSTRIDNPPLWLIQCSPNYKHIKVGSGTTGVC